MKNQLQKILNKLEKKEGNQQELAYEALALIKAMIKEDPFDVNIRITRMRLNADLFENTTAIIEDATFITENDQFEQSKMVGYDWLFWVYDTALSMRSKAIEVLEEQLVEMQKLFPVRYKKDEIESDLLNKLAQLKFNNDEKEAAINLWEKSFDKYPFLPDRNGFVGLHLLNNKQFEKAKKFLLVHYQWSFNTEDGYRLEYGIKLKELYDANELENEGDLVGLMFNIIRNEKDHFKISGKLDFYEKHHEVLEYFGEKFPESTLLWTAISNMHSLDTKNHQKAFEAYSKLAKTKDAFRFSSMKRAIKAAKKSDNNFFDLNFSFEHSAQNMYNCLTDLSTARDKVKSKKKKKKFAELAVAYGKQGYDKFQKYLYDGKGVPFDNQPHIFAMLCNNYANALGEYADLHHKKEEAEKEKLYTQAGDIHIEGFKVSPFVENLSNAARDYYTGKDYPNAIKYAKETIATYQAGLSVYDFQAHYHRIIRSSIALDDLGTAEQYYFKSKEIYNKVGKESKDVNYKFIFCGKVFYEYVVKDKKEYQKYIPEMEWYLDNEIAEQQQPLEHGLISYFLGLCYYETNQKENALKTFQITVDYLQDADWEFYDNKCEHAEDLIKELGGKVVKKAKEKNKSAFRRTIDALLFPFMIIALMGGIIWAAAMSFTPDEKNKTGDQ